MWYFKLALEISMHLWSPQRKGECCQSYCARGVEREVDMPQSVQGRAALPSEKNQCFPIF